MAATSEDIVNLLRQRRIIASSQIVDSLREHSDPAKLLDLGSQIDFHRGVLNVTLQKTNNSNKFY